MPFINVTTLMTSSKLCEKLQLSFVGIESENSSSQPNINDEIINKISNLLYHYKKSR